MAIPKLCTIDRYCMNIGELLICGHVGCEEHSDISGYCCYCECDRVIREEERYRHAI